MIVRRRVSINAVTRFAALYLVLVAYSAVYEYFYEYQLTPLYHDMFTAYDPTRAGIYTAIRYLTPLAILPIGTKLRAAGQFITGTLAIIVFIPIPIVFVPMTSIHEYWMTYSLLWIGYFIVCSLSSLDIKLRSADFSDARYKQLLTAILLVLGLGLVYVFATNHVQLVSLANAHAARTKVTVSGLQGYLLPGYVSSFGGLLVAIAVLYKRYYLIPVALVGFIACYATIEERTAAIMPFWIAYILLTQKYIFRKSAIGFLMCVMAPFLLLVFGATIIGTANRQSIFYDLFTLATYRVYSIPAIGFNVYNNFFHFNPHTYWSHINVVSKFVHNPYNGEPLGLVMDQNYHLGSYNTSFLETDGLAAAGIAVVPWICAVFGMVLVAVNSCMRGLSVRTLAIVTAGSSIALIDTGIGPGLLTNGLIILCAVLFFAPRRAPWTDVNRKSISREATPEA